MAKAKRVFQVAKELGVDSKVILDKCKAEGVDLHNHMSTLSVGLEMTIRQWFSESEVSVGGTAVETAEKVDLAKARKKARPRRKTKADEHEAEAEPPPPTPAAVIEPPALKLVEPAPGAPGPTPVAAPPPPPVQPLEPAEIVAEAPAPKPHAAMPNVPKRPEKVKRAGPKLEAPGAAKLKGPKVIRREAPDHVQSSPRPPRRGPAQPGPAEPQQEIIRTRGPARGRGAGAPPTDDEAARSPRRRRTTRRSRTESEVDFRRGRFSEQDLLEREERVSRAGGFLKQRRRDMKKRAETGVAGQLASPAEVGGRVAIAEPFTIKNLSAATGIKSADIIKFLFDKNVMATINHAIDAALAQEVCLEYDIELEVKGRQSAEQQMATSLELREPVDVRRRPPVVAVLGHVDHGKTSLLDRIRTAEVAAGEAGGITQHIGAYRATITGTDGKDKTVVFLDTPGHEAFTSMRARGANLTDLVVLVVSAADGVMPQTVESINHAKAAEVPIVVALNKVDRPDATEDNIRKILGQLAEHGLNPVEWGGQTEVMRTSATTGQGVTELVEILDYQAELMELKADYGGAAYGQVIEAELSEGRGPVARILVRGGELKIGDFIVMGRAFGRVRDMLDDRGKNIVIAGPATPLEISGIDDVPDAGDKFYVTATLRQAEEIATFRYDEERKRELASKTKVTLENVFEQMKVGAMRELRIVVKADVQGSVEVLHKTLEEVGAGRQDVGVRVLHAAVGGINESDVLLAETSDAVVIGFQVIASQHARAEAERRGVEIRLYRVIYDILGDVKAALEGLLATQTREQVLGHAQVREVFRITKVGMVAGCYVTDGVIKRNALIRVTRSDIVVEHDRTLDSLKRFKEDAKEVRAGMECGMSIDGYSDIQVGDVLECYETTEVKQKL